MNPATAAYCGIDLHKMTQMRKPVFVEVEAERLERDTILNAFRAGSFTLHGSNISIPSTGTGYEQLVKDPQGVANTAKILGSRYVMTAWIPHQRGAFNLDNAKKAVEDFNAAGKVLKENGITFCYHVHGFEFQPYEKGTLLDYMIKNTNPEYVSFEMDILWIYFGGGDPVGLLKKYGGRWKLLHVKDLKKGTPKDLTGGTSQENDVTLGTGEIDVAGVIREANKLGIKHFFIEDESSRVNTQVPQSIAYLKSLKK